MKCWSAAWSNQWMLHGLSITHCTGRCVCIYMSCQKAAVCNLMSALCERSQQTYHRLCILFGCDCDTHIHLILPLWDFTDSCFQQFGTSNLCLPSGLSASPVKWCLSNLNRSCEMTCWSSFIWLSALTRRDAAAACCVWSTKWWMISTVDHNNHQED